METAETISELEAALRLRRAAYGERAAARNALDQAQNNLQRVIESMRWDTGIDPVLTAAMKGREAIARIRIEEARERLREATRDLERARKIADPLTTKEFEIEHLD